jgi:hypothetical protein
MLEKERRENIAGRKEKGRIMKQTEIGFHAT